MAINIYFVSEIHSFLQNKHSCQGKLFRTLRTNGSKLTRNDLICSDGEVWQTHQHRIILCKQKQVDIALSWERNISEVWGNFLIQLITIIQHFLFNRPRNRRDYRRESSPDQLLLVLHNIIGHIFMSFFDRRWTFNLYTPNFLDRIAEGLYFVWVYLR